MDVDNFYQQNIDKFKQGETIHASHIFFPVAQSASAPEKDQARAKATQALKELKAGGDFAALAKQYSEDDASKVNGGDLDYFGRGAMVKEFDEAAFALKPGETSGLVKSQFGFHIIKVIDKRAAATRTLADVRTEIENQIRYEKAQAEASRVADEVAAKVSKPADLDAVAKERGLSVGDSGFFARDEPLAGLGFAPSVTAEAFTLEQGKVSGVLRTNQGYAIVALTETKPSYVPKVEEVRDKVKDDVIRAKAVELARAKAETMAQAAKTNFAAAAKAAGVDVKTTDFISRGSALPEVGVSDRVDSALFALKTGETTAPIATDNAVVVARVKERQEIDAAAMTAARDQLRAELLQQRRNTFFAAYMTKAKAKMTVTYNQAALQTIIGG
jgi:peptidyl-prolyl cis-trans isomerase D